MKFRIKSKIFLLDATIISLHLSLCDWVRDKTAKGAVKMHTLLDYDGNLPAYVNITDGKTPNNKSAYDVPLLKGSVIVADRFYNDFALLNVWDSTGVYFEVCHKENLQYTTVRANGLPQNSHPTYSRMKSSCSTTRALKKSTPKDSGAWPLGTMPTGRPLRSSPTKRLRQQTPSQNATKAVGR